MRTHITVFLALFISMITFAQQGINYKAILKDTNGNLLANTFMNIQFTIHQSTANGTIVYQEDHNHTTDANGLIILNLGTDTTPSIGVFANIDWSANLHFLQTTVNYSGGTIDFDATEFMAVPYALHAQNAVSLIGGETDPVFEVSEAASITTADISNWNTDISTSNETITSLSLNGTDLSITEAGNTVTEDLSSIVPFKMENVHIVNPGESEIKYLANLNFLQIYTFDNTLVFFQNSGFTTISVNIDDVANSFFLSGADFQGFSIPAGTGPNITIRAASNNGSKTVLFEGLKFTSNSVTGMLFYKD